MNGPMPASPEVTPSQPLPVEFAEARRIQALRRRVLVLFSLPAGLCLALGLLGALVAGFDAHHGALARPVELFRSAVMAVAVELPSLVAGTAAFAWSESRRSRGWFLRGGVLGAAWALGLAASVLAAYLVVERFLYWRYAEPSIRESGFAPPSFESLPATYPQVTLTDFLTVLGVCVILCLPTAWVGFRILHRAGRTD
ncbi:MAG TPA: hypothetical protein VK188_12535 [Holophaga sp.]|nr:hypothetical protein [Holophaga sp.]